MRTSSRADAWAAASFDRRYRSGGAGGAAASHHSEFRRTRRRADAGDDPHQDHFEHGGRRSALITVPEALIETALLEKLERLTIQWQKSLPGLVGGHNTSRFAGPGQEFLDHRNFHHGDDVRAVNWRAFLRLEKLFLKMFQLEPRIPVRILLDTSRSMETGTVPKFEYARKLAAALCYVGLVRLDSICIQPFAANLAHAFVASGGRHRFQPAVNFLGG